MKNHFQILIVGGGNAGISVAAQFLKENAQLDFEYETKQNMRRGGGKELVTNPLGKKLDH